LRGADAAVIATEWPEFAGLPWPAIRTSMRRPLIFDGRRLLDRAELERIGFELEAVGSAGPDVHAAVDARSDVDASATVPRRS
jgi:hypothetical protein